MRTVLVTLIGPQRTTDLAVDADTAVAELMPSLLRAGGVNGDAAPAEWTLAVMGREPVAPHLTLEQAEVLDGSVLVLRQESASVTAAPAGPASPSGPGGSPLRRARELLASAGAGPAEVIAGVRLARCPTVAVVSPKGGVGKTTVTIMLGEALADLLPVPVLALDADSDYGSLTRIGPPKDGTVLQALSEGAITFAELDRTLWMLPGGLRTVPAPRDPDGMARTDRTTYTRALGTLQRLAGVLLIDCGTGLGQPGVQAAIVASDQLVVVTDPAEPTVRLVSEATQLLSRAGRPITVLCNRLPRGRGGDEQLARIDPLFPNAAALAGIPADDGAALALGGEFQLRGASRPLQESVQEAAALLALGWHELGLTAEA